MTVGGVWSAFRGDLLYLRAGKTGSHTSSQLRRSLSCKLRNRCSAGRHLLAPPGGIERILTRTGYSDDLLGNYTRSSRNRHHEEMTKERPFVERLRFPVCLLLLLLFISLLLDLHKILPCILIYPYGPSRMAFFPVLRPP